MTHLSGSLGFDPSLMNPRQICQAIAPLAEALFPTPRIPVFRTHSNEGWIVFEESSALNVKPLKLARRTTPTSYSKDKGSNVNIPPIKEGSMPSTPLLQTSSMELVTNIPDPRDPPNFTGIEANKGKKSFLRPFLLGGRKKKGEMLAAVVHKSRQEDGSDVHSGEQLVNEDLQVDSGPPESPYEETAFSSEYDDNGDGDDGGQLSPIWAPLATKGKKTVSRRVAEIHVDEVIPASPVVMTPMISKVLLPPVTPDTSTPPVATSPIPSPVPTPTTASIQSTPVGTVIPITPVAMSPITAPSSWMRSPPQTPIPITPIVAVSTTPTHRESESKLGSGGDRHHRDRKETSDERRKRKEREHAKRGRGSDGERRSRPIRSFVEKEDTWLEVIFEDLPFGPDKNMVSTRRSAVVRPDVRH